MDVHTAELRARSVRVPGEHSDLFKAWGWATSAHEASMSAPAPTARTIFSVQGQQPEVGSVRHAQSYVISIGECSQT